MVDRLDISPAEGAGLAGLAGNVTEAVRGLPPAPATRPAEPPENLVEPPGSGAARPAASGRRPGEHTGGTGGGDVADGTGLFVYGIVPSDVEPTPDAAGVGDPPGEVAAIRHGELAALVSEVGLGEPLGRPADLTAYQELLDGTAAVAPVLPVRFGTVVTGPAAVTELLTAHHDRFAAALDGLEDRIEYMVHGRYHEQPLLGELLAADPEAADLARQVRGQPEVATRPQRIRLGEIVSQAVELRREAENRHVLDAVTSLVVDSAARPPSSELDAVNLAFLVDSARADEFVDALEAYAGQRRDLLRMRLLGPHAPYDFVAEHQLAG
ncbi:GvpL/GvpF family gas vesicle protein [Micromonospora sp. NPDC002296]|uniref:GvpL/GvpF family gas vesicle protein n=1 Tax=Micromonospora sp. NPDC002296 TaxID=3154271 RepID=UPI00331A500E